MLEYFRMVTSGVLPESYSSAKLNESPESSDDGVVFKRSKSKKQSKRKDLLRKGNLSQERRLAIEKEKSKKPNKHKSKTEEVQTISKEVLNKEKNQTKSNMEVLSQPNNWLNTNLITEGKCFFINVCLLFL